MAKKKTTAKKAKKTTRKERSKIKKADHARARVRDARAREKEVTEAPRVIPYPQAGAKVIEFEQELDRQLGGAPIGAGPAAGIPTEPGEIKSFDYAVLIMAFQIPFDLWAISQDVDQLKLSDKEARLMAKPAKELLDYYLPQIPVIAWAWISLAIVSYSTLKTRLLIIQEIKKRSVTSEQAAEAGGKSASAVSPGPQGHGGPPPSGVVTTFPTMKQIKNPVA